MYAVEQEGSDDSDAARPLSDAGRRGYGSAAPRPGAHGLALCGAVHAATACADAAYLSADDDAHDLCAAGRNRRPTGAHFCHQLPPRLSDTTRSVSLTLP